jgi:hypothetical protein
MPVTASPSLLMQQLQAQFEQFVAATGQDWDLAIVEASVQPTDRGRGPGLCVLVCTAGGMAFEVPFNPAVDDVAVFLAELTKLPERPPVAKDGVPPLVVH